MEFLPVHALTRSASIGYLPMPVLSQLSDPAEWLDPDDVPRPVVTVGTTGIDMKTLDEKAAA